MKLVDSCGWLEFFADGPRADKYAIYLKKMDEVLVPAIVLYEVYKKVKKETGEEELALLAVSQMQRGKLVAFDEELALFAADLSMKHALPMADAMVYAIARQNNATLVTGDLHFSGLDNVEYLR